MIVVEDYIALVVMSNYALVVVHLVVEDYWIAVQVEKKVIKVSTMWLVLHTKQKTTTEGLCLQAASTSQCKGCLVFPPAGTYDSGEWGAILLNTGTTITTIHSAKQVADQPLLQRYCIAQRGLVSPSAVWNEMQKHPSKVISRHSASPFQL